MSYQRLVTVNASPPVSGREVYGVLNYDTRKFSASAIKVSNQWGLQPATATLEFIADSPLCQGQVLDIYIAGYEFHGICKSCTFIESTSSGKKYDLEFADYREYLNSWDDVYCYFNKMEHITIDGKRYRRWVHIYPADWDFKKKTYTNSPLTAAQIIEAMLRSKTVGVYWKVFYSDLNSNIFSGYHPSLKTLPSYDIDCESGKKLGAAIQEVIDQHGILLTILPISTSGTVGYDLVFARKGEGSNVEIPTDSDDRRVGIVLTDNPTRIRIIGEDNLYQFHNISVEPDWAPGWSRFFDTSIFVQWVFENGKTPDGVKFNAIPGDVEYTIGYQLAKSKALEMTVSQVASVLGKENFADYRKCQGKCRMDMPAFLYIKTLLFRAFKLPNSFSFKNTYGNLISYSDTVLSSEMLCGVTHDPITGKMSWNVDDPPDGGGYAIVQGYRIGEDSFKTINPKRFNMDQWISSQSLWQHIPFTLDDSGEADGKYLAFDDPVILSEDLFYIGDTGSEKSIMNGFCGLRANPTIRVPNVQVALTFQAETFANYFGNGSKDETVRVNGLSEQFVGTTSDYTSIPFSDGENATYKAESVANSYLSRQYSYPNGSYRIGLFQDSDGNWPTPILLTGIVDRISLDYSSKGLFVVYDLTAERTARTFERARDFDRKERDRGLFAGQKELKNEATTLLLTAKAMSRDRRFVKDMADALHGDTTQVLITTPTVGDKIPIGTPIWKSPQVGGENSTASATSGAATQNVFVGTSIIHNQTVGEMCRVKQDGVTFIRVKGPVAVNQTVGKPTDSTADYLVASGNTVAVGTALQAITTTDIRLIEVRLGAAASETTESILPFRVVKASDTQVQIKEGYLLGSFDVTNSIPISGFDTVFSVSAGQFIYLEILFKKPTSTIRQDPILASLCVGKWTGYPDGVRFVTKLAYADAVKLLDSEFALGLHIGLDANENGVSKALALDELNSWGDLTVKQAQWAAYVPIAQVLDGENDDCIVVNDSSGSPVSIKQLCASNMMLQGFCENYYPVSMPTPYGGPILSQCSIPDISGTSTSTGNGNYGVFVSITVASGETAYYSVNGGSFSEYSSPFVVDGSKGSTVSISAYSIADGKYDSPSVTESFTI